ncbi:MAG TPA: acyltransferase family protein [Candidatus Blautia avistercoris]|nr:acyltransferase family protein [Candidatus Blautia avistercoris]
MRNSSIDSLKAVAAYFVIFIHFSFPEWFGEAADAAARTAVPVFFLVSGYFCCPKDS